MNLPREWERFLQTHIDTETLYLELDRFLNSFSAVMPARPQIFSVFNYMHPEQVRAVLYGEDPYPRSTSANGVAFWDAEISSWQDKTNGNSLKNMLKALLVHQGVATYATPIAECRRIAEKQDFASPPELFRLWLNQGVLLVNTALTFSGKADKKAHFAFWKPFHLALIKALNSRKESPVYILWGKKAQNWEEDILGSIDENSKIIRQGHPTFIHQFLRKEQPSWSPFAEIEAKTRLQWI
jgi:uracil DNA glycosylase